MSLYEDENISRDKLHELRKSNKCKECGADLVVLWDMDYHKAYLTCNSDQSHEGIMREASRYEKEGLATFNINTRREIMVSTYGEKMTKELEKARLPMSGALTKVQAMDMLKLVYPKAPETQIIRTAIFCQDFGLHPLANEVYLIPYKDTWVMVVGIPANRKIAHNLKGEFSFLDDTPRAASNEEIIKQFGKDSDEAKSNVISVTKLQGKTGNLAIGFGLYSINETPKGIDKGNTRRNMANIRSERQAMDRLPGKQMPSVEVVDEKYIDTPNVGKVDTTGGEVVESTAIELPNEESPAPTETPVETKEHWCIEHDCAYDLKQGKYGPFYSHDVPGGYCKEKKKKAEAPKAEPVPEPESVDGELIPQTTDQLFTWLATKMNWKDAKTARTWIVNVCRISEDRLNTDLEGCYHEIKALKEW